MSNYISKFKSPYQEVFGTTPINQEFIDANGNNVTYRKVQIGNLNSGKIDFANPVYTSVPDVDITIEFSAVDIPLNTSNGTLYSESFGGISSHFRITVTPTGGVNFFLYNQQAVELIQNIQTNGITNSLDGDFHTVRWVDNNGSCEIWYDGVLNKSFSYIVTGDIIMNIATYGALFFGNYVNYYSSKVKRITTGRNDCHFQDGDDDIIINTVQNEPNGAYSNGIISDFRGTRIDDIDSILINNGYSLFQQIADSTKYITAAYGKNGNPTLITKVGYNKVAEIPPNVVSNNKITYSGILNAGISETDASFDDIDGVEIIPKDILQVTEEDGVFTDWAVQPYESEPLKDVNGEILYDVNGEKLYPLKEF